VAVWLCGCVAVWLYGAFAKRFRIDRFEGLGV
jgi:hypothetical protein